MGSTNVILEDILIDLCEHYEKTAISTSSKLSLGQNPLLHGLHPKEQALEELLPIDIQLIINQSTKTAALYKRVLEIVLSRYNANSTGTCRPTYETFVEKVFLKGFCEESLVVLCGVIQVCSPSVKLDLAINLLEKYLQCGSLTQLLQHQTLAAADTPIAKPIWEKLISLLVTIPERIANKFLGNTKAPFDIPSYIDLLARALLTTLHQVHTSLSTENNASLEFHSQLLGRLCLAGHGALLMRFLTPQLVDLSKNNFLWRRIVTRLIVGVPDRCLEAVLKALLNHVQWYGHMKYFLGDHVQTKSTLKILITKKFLLTRFFKQTNVIQNCIGYLADDQNRHIIFLKTLKNVLDVWGNGTSLKHRSLEQQLYLSSALMIFSSHLSHVDFSLQKSELLPALLTGIQVHISCSTESLRNQGMIIGLHLTKIFEPSGPQIEFECPETEETKILLSLSKIPEEPVVELGKEFLNVVQEEKDLSENSNVQKEASAVRSDELDSDDEFEPYNQRNDTPFVKDKQAHYVTDCLEGLTDLSNVDWSLACFQNLENCIKTQTAAATEIATELSKILLHLENQFAAPDFISTRFKTLVAVCVLSPKQVASYLTEQFYDRNYSIRQRLDILEVIAAASQQLSGLKSSGYSENTPSGFEGSPASLLQHDLHWKNLVQKRIDAKTRRISKGKPSKEVQVSENRFSEVAGYFFFPLLRYYDRQENAFDLFGQDSYLLGRLVSTLGIVINSAANTIVVKNLAKVLLEFMLGLRFHTEAFVRQSLLFSLCMVIINVLPNILIEDFQEEIMEYQEWLQSVALNDPDFDCQKLAKQILSLLTNTVYTQAQ